MNKYELAVVFDPSLDDEAKVAEFEKVKDLISRFGGAVDKVDDWGKRRLAYEIQKKNEGYYNFICFTADKDAPSELESRLRIQESILRYLILRLED